MTKGFPFGIFRKDEPRTPVYRLDVWLEDTERTIENVLSWGHDNITGLSLARTTTGFVEVRTKDIVSVEAVQTGFHHD